MNQTTENKSKGNFQLSFFCIYALNQVMYLYMGATLAGISQLYWREERRRLQH